MALDLIAYRCPAVPTRPGMCEILGVVGIYERSAGSDIVRNYCHGRIALASSVFGSSPTDCYVP